jgi:hypothetical protein
LSPSTARQCICAANVTKGDDGDQDVLRAPVLQLVHHREPEFGALVLGDPQAQDLTLAVAGDAQRHVDGLVLHRPAIGVADLHPQCVEDHDRIHPLQRTALPFPDLVEHRVGDTADQVGRDLQSIEIEQVGLDVADRQPGGVEPNDLVVHPVDPGLAFLHQLGLEAAVAVAGHRNGHLAVLPLQHLARGAIPAVALTRGPFLARLVTHPPGTLLRNALPGNGCAASSAPSIRSMSLIFSSFISPVSPSRSSGRSTPFSSSSSSSLEIVMHASFRRSMDRITHTQKI